MAITNRVIAIELPSAGGTVQTLVCKRDGMERWRKQVYIPFAEQDEAFKRYLSKRHGGFFYDLVDKPRVVKRRPANVPPWDNF